MAKVFTLEITYAGCGGRIWRRAAVSSNSTLAELGYFVLAAFEASAFHMFDMECKGVRYTLLDEDEGGDSLLLHRLDSRQLDLRVGDSIKMTYDYDCCQVFDVKVLDICDMPNGSGSSYPKILDGEGVGIVEDLPAAGLLEAIKRIDNDESSGIFYAPDDYMGEMEWDYRDFDLEYANLGLKRQISFIRECYLGDSYDEEPAPEFRELRRIKQQLPDSVAEEVLRNGSTGVLGVIGDYGYPYTVPLNYVYDKGKIYFHCAAQGHKLDAIRGCPKVSFCVIASDKVIKEKLTTAYLSVIVFGKARVLQNSAETTRAALLLAEKYGGSSEEAAREVEAYRPTLRCVEITIEHQTAKAGLEFVAVE